RTWAAGGSAAQQYDDVKIGYDNNGDDDILDASDDIQASDDFGSNVMSLSYDNNGNLTDDGGEEPGGVHCGVRGRRRRAEPAAGRGRLELESPRW
ncbi:MAG: hypothetical protein AB1716_17475, partial [Planctomycetota bacterium]